MASLRMTVRENNVFRWAGRMLADAGRFRLRERIAARVQRHTDEHQNQKQHSQPDETTLHA
jgi:trehalose 6-phosphate synthase